MEKVTSWPSVKSEDSKALKAYGLFIRECFNAMEELRYLEELNMPANLKLLCQKLPYKLRVKWREKACEILERTGQRACFPDIVHFIKRQVRILTDPVFGDIQDTPPVKGATKSSKPQTKPQLKGNSFATHVSIEDGDDANANENEDPQNIIASFTSTNPTSCLYCNARGHVLEQGHQLGRKTHREKLD